MKANTMQRFGTPREIGWDLLRIYLGAALVIKGFAYQLDEQRLVAEMVAAHVPFASGALAELVAVSHIAGGLSMAFGLFTRIGAAIQLPAVLGAVLFIHLPHGLFSQNETLEFALFVLFALGLYTVMGAGRLSIDSAFADRKRGELWADGGQPVHVHA